MEVAHPKSSSRTLVFSLLAALLALMGTLFLGFPMEFGILFGTLACVVSNHHKARQSALVGTIIAVLWAWFHSPQHLAHVFREEAGTILDTVICVAGFTVLACLTSMSGVLNLLARKSGHGFWGAFWVLLWQSTSYAVDNVASALNGGEIARLKYRDRVHPSYIFAKAGLANAFGAMSAIGDGTSMLLWILGVSFWGFWDAWPGVLVAFLVIAPFAAWVQARYAHGHERDAAEIEVKPLRILPPVIFILGVVAVIIFRSQGMPASFGVWGAVLTGYYLFHLRQPAEEFKKAGSTAAFLAGLMLIAALCPKGAMPDPSFQQEMGLGFFSSIFDNYPLTYMAAQQSPHFWALLAFAVGFGGSLMWFGNAASVALAEHFQSVKVIRYTWWMSIVMGLALAAGCYAISWYHGGWIATPLRH
ncbi:MAG: hypothetical protein K1X79_12660 [Oligoflexia bacterium]|nr:hypothetical protein [Oligoflexia bacterium]